MIVTTSMEDRTGHLALPRHDSSDTPAATRTGEGASEWKPYDRAFHQVHDLTNDKESANVVPRRSNRGTTRRRRHEPTLDGVRSVRERSPADNTDRATIEGLPMTTPTTPTRTATASPSQARATRKWSKSGCRVAVYITIPDPTRFALRPASTGKIYRLLDGRDPRISTVGSAMLVTFFADEPSPIAAAEDVHTLVDQVTDELGQTSDTAYEIQIAVAEDASAPTSMATRAPIASETLVGLAEAAEILGVSRQRIHQLANAGRLPEPCQRVSATPLWWREDIETFGHRRRRRPGRPPRNAEVVQLRASEDQVALV